MKIKCSFFLLSFLMLSACVVESRETLASDDAPPAAETQSERADIDSSADCAGDKQSGEITEEIPDTICSEAQYVIYLHGKIVEDEGVRPTHPQYGVYEYPETLEVIAAEGFHVISETRPANTDGYYYATKVKAQVQTLLEAGIPPEKISVIGFSKGGGIAMITSSLLQHEQVNFVFIASCSDWAFEDTDLQISGRILSLYEASDDYGESCQLLFDRSEMVSEYQEVRLETGLEHGAFYRPDPEWVQPMLEWMHD